ncbi:RidA family protein [Faecalicoccus pleomorphus]|uniref:RidA family protein n=1 Tax=Faecalicoccus pleomorphus TaxID=1323 RepID=UPI0019600CF1|nr:RidA family protein [Faecalicoccus pleomorphus]MBM6808168.1 RidA family protein [Faecalicoccus pleomorphus]
MKKIHTEKAPAAIGPYSQAVVHNGVLYTSGQVPLDPVTGEIVGSDIQSQANQVLKNLEQILKEAGTDFSKVIKTTCFLADMKDFVAFNEVYASYITEKPARSCVAVKELPKQVLVEVEVIAAIEE